jgi:DNA repair protein RadC
MECWKMKTNDIKQYTDKELIGTILSVNEVDPAASKRTHPAVRAVMEAMGSKQDHVTYEDLTSIEGIGQETAIKVLACFEIARRYKTPIDPTDKVVRPEDCLKYLEAYRREKQEYFIAITLNGAGEVLGVREITKGLLNHSLVHPREVFAPAIEDRAVQSMRRFFRGC